MNKKEIAAIRKQLRLDTDLLTITDIYKFYIKQESSDNFQLLTKVVCRKHIWTQYGEPYHTYRQTKALTLARSWIKAFFVCF
jgi:hypothetical protein